MAKDGTNRGGARIGAGAKKKPLADKLAEGNPGKRELTVIDFDNQSADLEGQPMPKPSRLLSAKQKDGKSCLLRQFIKKHGNGCRSAIVLPWSLQTFWNAML